MKLLDYVVQFFCRHKHTIKKTSGGRLYLECIGCGYETPGVMVYNAQTTGRIAA